MRLLFVVWLCLAPAGLALAVTLDPPERVVHAYLRAIENSPNGSDELVLGGQLLGFIERNRLGEDCSVLTPDLLEVLHAYIAGDRLPGLANAVLRRFRECDQVRFDEIVWSFDQGLTVAVARDMAIYPDNPDFWLLPPGTGMHSDVVLCDTLSDYGADRVEALDSRFINCSPAAPGNPLGLRYVTRINRQAIVDFLLSAAGEGVLAGTARE
jgi:hypothetical protein